MSAETRRRILILLDASAESLAATEATAELAAALRAELVGLFVEDAELLELAGYPLARVLDPLTGTLHPLDGLALDNRLRAQAMRARDTLLRTARARGVLCSFRVERGKVLEEIQVASKEVDLVTLSRVGWSAGRGRLGSTAQAVLSAGSRSVFVHGRKAPSGAPVFVCYDESSGSRAALELAAELASRGGSPLSVVVFAPSEEAARLRESEVRRAVVGQDLDLRFEPHVPDGDALVESLRNEPCALLVLPARGPVPAQEIASVVVEVEAPVLITR